MTLIRAGGKSDADMHRHMELMGGQRNAKF